MSTDNQSSSEIDEWIRTVIPPMDLLIPDLLTFRLPSLIKETSLSSADAVASLSLESPTVELDALLDIPMPPRKWVSEVSEVLGDHADTVKVNSIQHPTEDSTYLPLSAVRLWDALAGAVEQREAWSVAMQSLERWEDDPNAAAARTLIATVQWGRPTSGLRGSDARSPIGILATLLSNQWLSERHLDIIGRCLNAPPDIVVEASLATTVKALEGKSSEDITAVPELERLRKEVDEGRCNRIFFPTNINNTHWIVFCVNIKTRTIAYGVSIYSFFDGCPD